MVIRIGCMVDGSEPRDTDLTRYSVSASQRFAVLCSASRLQRFGRFAALRALCSASGALQRFASALQRFASALPAHLQRFGRFGRFAALCSAHSALPALCSALASALPALSAG